MTQGERIVKFVQDFGSITPMEAFKELGITKLATRIGELERSGQYKFNHEPVSMTNSYGEPVRYMKYSFEVEA